MRILLLLLISFSIQAKPLIVSHKGIWKSHVYPQNTMESLEMAVGRGFEGIEFDLQLSSDNHFVLSHDDKIKRISDCEGEISHLSINYLEDCNITHNTTLPITQILLKRTKKTANFTTLSRVLQKLGNKDKLKLIWLDLKISDRNVANLIVEKLSNFSNNVLEKLIIGNKSAEVLKTIKDRLPQVRTSLEGDWGSEPLVDYEKYLDGIGITHDIVSLNVGLHMGYKGALNPFVRKCRFWKLFDKYMKEASSRGVTTIGWTVNSKRKLKKLVSKGLDIILTDRTELPQL